jgi:hypothetical protein
MRLSATDVPFLGLNSYLLFTANKGVAFDKLVPTSPALTATHTRTHATRLVCARICTDWNLRETPAGRGRAWAGHWFDADSSLRHRRQDNIGRSDSSALDLAYLASGRCDAVWERNLNYWDVAAGIVIVKEAGGTVTDFKGGDKYIEDRNLLATNSKIDKDLIALLA